MDRTEFRTIEGISLAIREARAHEIISEDLNFSLSDGDLVLVRMDNGKIVASVSRDQIFDVGGNRFYF